MNQNPHLDLIYEWINEFGPKHPQEAYGRCKEFCNKIIDKYPHINLKLCKGFYIDDKWGKRSHWWLKCENEIIDPTSIQFPSMGDGEYISLEDEECPTGKCINCGKYCFDYKLFCCEECSIQAEKEFIKN